jgi:hypothetical protein
MMSYKGLYRIESDSLSRLNIAQHIAGNVYPSPPLYAETHFLYLGTMS